jgi:hypothetical protein
MNFWDENRNLLFVAGGFLAVCLLMYIAVWSSNSSDIENLEAKRKNDIGKDIDQLFTDGSRVVFLQKEFSRYNRRLEERKNELVSYVSSPFDKSPLPEEKISHRQAFTRETLEKLQNEVRFAAGSRKINVTDEACTLGMVLPEEYTESLKLDVEWLKQMKVCAGMLKLLMEISEDESGELGIFEITRIHPMQITEGGTPVFIREYPVEIEMLASMKGIMTVLHTFSSKGSFWAVKSFDVSSVPEDRKAIMESKKIKDMPDGGRLMARMSQHYYRLIIRACRIETFTPEKGIDKKEDKKKVDRKKVKPLAY